MPWFCLTALLHTIIVLEKRLILKSWTIILSIATFALSMTGTFLVRSGILNSIHTFANDPTRGVFILIFLFLLIIIALFIYFIYSEKEKIVRNNIFIINKETSILINNWFMMYFLSVVLIGTVYPIFLEVINNHKISIDPPRFLVLTPKGIGHLSEFIDSVGIFQIDKKTLHLDGSISLRNEIVKLTESQIEETLLNFL